VKDDRPWDPIATEVPTVKTQNHSHINVENHLDEEDFPERVNQALTQIGKTRTGQQLYGQLKDLAENGRGATVLQSHSANRVLPRKNGSPGQPYGDMLQSPEEIDAQMKRAASSHPDRGVPYEVAWNPQTTAFGSDDHNEARFQTQDNREADLTLARGLIVGKSLAKGKLPDMLPENVKDTWQALHKKAQGGKAYDFLHRGATTVSKIQREMEAAEGREASEQQSRQSTQQSRPSQAVERSTARRVSFQVGASVSQEGAPRSNRLSLLPSHIRGSDLEEEEDLPFSAAPGNAPHDSDSEEA
jgi:hypothetical protein